MKLQNILLCTIALTTILGGTTAFAANEEGYTDATNVTSDGKITFSQDDDVVNPVDPNDPDTPINPVDPVNPNGAELMINYASNLNFGEQAKSGNSWNALADNLVGGGTIAPFISTKDSRGTDRTAWTLTVKQDGEFKDSNENVLRGAELTYTNLFYADREGAPTAKTGDITLSTIAQELSSASETTGIGNWSLGLGELQEDGTTTGVKLTVPQTSAKNTDTYTATVTYELTADATK